MYSFKLRHVFSALVAVLLCTSIQGQGIRERMQVAFGVAFVAVNDMVLRFGSGGIEASNTICTLDQAISEVIKFQVRFQCTSVLRVVSLPCAMLLCVKLFTPASIQCLRPEGSCVPRRHVHAMHELTLLAPC